MTNLLNVITKIYMQMLSLGLIKCRLHTKYSTMESCPCIVCVMCLRGHVLRFQRSRAEVS